MKPFCAPLLVTAMLFALSGPVTGQVTARQGDRSQTAIQEFHSPMILELPLKDFGRLAAGSGKDFKEVKNYYCDDLTVSELVVVKAQEARRGKPPDFLLEISGAAYVRPSYDRLATLRFDAVKGDQLLATTQVSNLKVGEDKTRKFKTELRLDAKSFEKLLAEGGPALLRVTVTVLDDR